MRDGDPGRIFTEPARTDPLIAVRRGSGGFKLMLDAHMDEIGFGTCLLSDFDHTWRLLAAFCRTAPGV